MTSHKPFTAEQLDKRQQLLEFDRDKRQPGVIVDLEEYARLIAQAREEIRLREAQIPSVECWGNYGPYGGSSNEPCGWSGPQPADKTCPTCHAGYLRLRGMLAVTKNPAKLRVIPQSEPLSDREQEMRFRQRVPEAPAARAKRELGEWLAENYEMRKARLQRHDGMFRIHLHDSGYFNSSGPWCASEHEAITAALRAAKGEKP